MIALVRLACRDLDVEHDAQLVVDRRMLLVAGLEPAVAPGSGHGGVGVGGADLLEAAGLLRVAGPPLGLWIGSALAVGLRHRPDVLKGKALPGDVGPDQGGVDVHDLASGDAGLDAGADRALEDGPQAPGPPALTNAGERRVIRQAVVEAVAGEPPDGEVHLRLAHQAAVMDDAEQEARQHQADRRLRVDPRPANARGVEFRHRLMQPAKVEHPVDAGQHVIVANEVPQRAADEELELIALLPTQHHQPPTPWKDKGIRAHRLFQRPHAAALPGGAREGARDGGLEPLMGVGDDELGAPQAALGEGLEEGRPEGLGLRRPDVQPHDPAPPTGRSPRPRLWPPRRRCARPRAP